MTSLQQAPASGQQLPPATVIDAAIKQHADKDAKTRPQAKRAVKPAEQPTVNRVAIAVDMALNYTQGMLEGLRRNLQRDIEETDTMVGSSVWRVVDVALDEVRRIRDAGFTDLKSFEDPFLNVASLCYCMAAAYDVKETYCARTLDALARDVDVMLALVEQEASK